MFTDFSKMPKIGQDNKNTRGRRIEKNTFTISD